MRIITLTVDADEVTTTVHTTTEAAYASLRENFFSGNDDVPDTIDGLIDYATSPAGGIAFYVDEHEVPDPREQEAGLGRLSATRAHILDEVSVEMDSTEDNWSDEGAPTHADYRADVMTRFVRVLDVEFHWPSDPPRRAPSIGLDAASLRAEVLENQDYTAEQRDFIAELTDGDLFAALDKAAGDNFWQAYDDARSTAIRYLLREMEEES